MPESLRIQKADSLRWRIDEMDAEIDRIVHQLYDLSEEEIRIVERKE